MRVEAHGIRLTLAITVLALGAARSPVAAQCSVATNSGENVYVKDPIGGCQKIALSFGNPVSKPRVRRDMTTHVIVFRHFVDGAVPIRSEEHTSELQSLAYLVCRLLLEKKKKKKQRLK